MPQHLQPNSGTSVLDCGASFGHPPVLVVATLFCPSCSLPDFVARLARSLESDGERRLAGEVHVLLYDNSPQDSTSAAGLIAPIRYEHHPENGGTRASILRAVELAVELGFDWILMLDQDSSLPGNYLGSAFAQANVSPKTAAIVPDVYHGEALISPCRVTLLGRTLPCRSGEQVIETAVLSGTIFSVNHIRAIEQPPEIFWLDFLDHWIFRSFKRRKLQVLGVPMRIEHDLSVGNPSRIPAWRMRNILRSEQAFIAGEGVIARWAYPARLALRAVRQLALCSPHWQVTWAALRRRI